MNAPTLLPLSPTLRNEQSSDTSGLPPDSCNFPGLISAYCCSWVTVRCLSGSSISQGLGFSRDEDRSSHHTRPQVKIGSKKTNISQESKHPFTNKSVINNGRSCHLLRTCKCRDDIKIIVILIITTLSPFCS